MNIGTVSYFKGYQEFVVYSVTKIAYLVVKSMCLKYHCISRSLKATTWKLVDNLRTLKMLLIFMLYCTLLIYGYLYTVVIL